MYIVKTCRGEYYSFITKNLNSTDNNFTKVLLNSKK